MTRRALAALLVLVTCGVAFAVEAQWLDVTKFVGIQQQAPSALCETGSCRAQLNVDGRQLGVIQRIPSESSMGAVTTFGTVSNETRAMELDPLGADSPRMLVVAADVTAPTTGSIGQHILAAQIADTGNGISLVANTPEWRQIDDPFELAYDTSTLDGFVGLTKYHGLGFISCDQGILEIGGEKGLAAATASLCMTAAWVGAPARPTAVVSGTSGNPSGSYRYRVTYVSNHGESMPSKPSAPVTAAGKKITLTIDPGPIEDGETTSYVVARKIYRTAGSTVALTNASLESWSGGAPTGWTISGTGASGSTTSDESVLLWSAEQGEDEWLESQNSRNASATCSQAGHFAGNALSVYATPGSTGTYYQSVASLAESVSQVAGSKRQKLVANPIWRTPINVTPYEQLSIDAYIPQANLANIADLDVTSYLGTSDWDSHYTGDVAPTADSPAWTLVGSAGSVTNGAISLTGNGPYYYRTITAGGDLIVRCRVKQNCGTGYGDGHEHASMLLGGATVAGKGWRLEGWNFGSGSRYLRWISLWYNGSTSRLLKQWEVTAARFSSYQQIVVIQSGSAPYTVSCYVNMEGGAGWEFVGSASPVGTYWGSATEIAWGKGLEVVSEPDAYATVKFDDLFYDTATAGTLSFSEATLHPMFAPLNATNDHDVFASVLPGWATYVWDRANCSTINEVQLGYCETQGSLATIGWDNLRGLANNAEQGTYAARLVRTTNDAKFYQAFNATAFRTMPVTVFCSVKCATASRARIAIYDDGNSTTYYSDYHTGDDTWQTLSVTHTMSVGAGAGSRVELRVDGGAASAIFDGVIIVAGGANGSAYFYLATVPNATATTYVDNLADTSMGAAEDRANRWYTPPGPWIEAHHERLWSCGSTGPTTQRNVLYYSDLGLPDSWPPLNFIDMGGNDGDPVTGLKSWNGSLFIFKRSSIWRVRGYSEDDFECSKVLDGIGCVDGRTIISNNRGIMFYGAKTMWLFDGQRAVDVGGAVGSFLEDVYFDSNNDQYQMGASARGSEFWFGLKDDDVTYPASWICFDADTSRWSRLRWNYNPAWIIWPGTRSEWMLGAIDDGKFYRLDGPGHDDNTALTWTSQSFDFGDRTTYKTVDKITLVVESEYAATNAYTVSLYSGQTDSKLEATEQAIYSSKQFSVTTGLNQFEWWLNPDPNVVSAGGNRFQTLSIGITEVSQSSDATQRSELAPPRVTSLSIQYRPERRVP
jgi:hypothetical protein